MWRCRLTRGTTSTSERHGRCTTRSCGHPTWARDGGQARWTASKPRMRIDPRYSCARRMFSRQFSRAPAASIANRDQEGERASLSRIAVEASRVQYYCSTAGTQRQSAKKRTDYHAGALSAIVLNLVTYFCCRFVLCAMWRIHRCSVLSGRGWSCITEIDGRSRIEGLLTQRKKYEVHMFGISEFTACGVGTHRVRAPPSHSDMGEWTCDGRARPQGDTEKP